MAQRKRPNDPEMPPSQALRRSLRMRIVAACSERETTSKEFGERAKIPEANASYYFRKLEQEGYLRVSRKEQARGATRHYYVAVRQALLVNEEFGELAPDQRRGVSDATLRDLMRRYLTARDTGTLGANRDTQFCCVRFDLDERGWGELMDELLWMFQRSLDLEVESSLRRRRSGEQPISVTVALAGFESPPRTKGERPESTLPGFFALSVQALEKGTLDARADSHLTWVPLELDEVGWAELVEDHARLRNRAFEIATAAVRRRRRSGEKPISTAFALCGFESPVEKRRARGEQVLRDADTDRE